MAPEKINTEDWDVEISLWMFLCGYNSFHIFWFYSSLIFLAALLSVFDFPVAGKLTSSICLGTS